MNKNMRIYEEGRNVPPEAKKAFNNGKFSGTDINPMWRIKKLTELFGPAGVGWYYEVISERSERLNDDTVIAVVDLNLYIKQDGEWSKPIYGTGGNQLVSKTSRGISTSDEGYKMALTDALSVACKALGIGADVYFDKDKTKYTMADGQDKNRQPDAPARPSGTAKMADEKQIKYLCENASEEQCMKMMNMYGADLSLLTYQMAERLIDKLKTGGAK